MRLILKMQNWEITLVHLQIFSKCHFPNVATAPRVIVAILVLLNDHQRPYDRPRVA